MDSSSAYSNLVQTGDSRVLNRFGELMKRERPPAGQTGVIHDKDLSRENTHLPALVGRISWSGTVDGLAFARICRFRSDLSIWIRSGLGQRISVTSHPFAGTARGRPR